MYLKPMLERASIKPVVVERTPAERSGRQVKAGAQSRKRRKTVAEDEDELPDLIGAK